MTRSFYAKCSPTMLTRLPDPITLTLHTWYDGCSVTHARFTICTVLLVCAIVRACGSGIDCLAVLDQYRKSVTLTQ